MSIEISNENYNSKQFQRKKGKPSGTACGTLVWGKRKQVSGHLVEGFVYMTSFHPHYFAKISPNFLSSDVDTFVNSSSA